MNNLTRMSKRPYDALLGPGRPLGSFQIPYYMRDRQPPKSRGVNEWPQEMEKDLIKFFKKYDCNWNQIYQQLCYAYPDQMDSVLNPREVANKMVSIWKKAIQKLNNYYRFEEGKNYAPLSKALAIAHKVEGFFHLKVLLIDFYYAASGDISRQRLQALIKFIKKLQADKRDELSQRNAHKPKWVKPRSIVINDDGEDTTNASSFGEKIPLSKKQSKVQWRGRN